MRCPAPGGIRLARFQPGRPRADFRSGVGAARRIIEAWQADYNANRPHTSLHGLTPNEFAARVHNGPQPERILVMTEGF